VSADPGRAGRWWLAPTFGLVVVFVVAAGLVARHFYQPRVAKAATVVLPPGTATAAPVTGGTDVTLTADAYASPWRDKIQPLLQDYFDAINQKRYDQWRASVTADRARQEPQSTWLRDFRSTHDSDIAVYRIDPAPDNGLRVLLSFRSRQAFADAPNDFPYACIQWQVVWPLSWVSDAWRLDIGSAGATPLRQQC
jgi:hypothetical protein